MQGVASHAPAGRFGLDASARRVPPFTSARTSLGRTRCLTAQAQNTSKGYAAASLTAGACRATSQSHHGQCICDHNSAHAVLWLSCRRAPQQPEELSLWQRVQDGLRQVGIIAIACRHAPLARHAEPAQGTGVPVNVPRFQKEDSAHAQRSGWAALHRMWHTRTPTECVCACRRAHAQLPLRWRCPSRCRRWPRPRRRRSALSSWCS